VKFQSIYLMKVSRKSVKTAPFSTPFFMHYLLFFQSFFSVFVTHFSLFFSHIFCCFFHTFFISKTCEISVNLPDESQLKSQLKIHHSVPPFSCIIHCFFKHFSLSLSHIFHCFFHAFSVCFSIYFSLTQHMIFQLIYPMKFNIIL